MKCREKQILLIFDLYYVRLHEVKGVNLRAFHRRDFYEHKFFNYCKLYEKVLIMVIQCHN